MPYGVHSALGLDCTYCAILRDPVERVISWYRHKVRKCQIAPDTSLIDFAGGPDFEVENGMTKRLAGRHWNSSGETVDIHGAPAPGPCRAAEFAAASAHLTADGMLVGIQEQFDLSVACIARRLDLPPPRAIGVQNHDPEERPEWDARAIELIRERNGYDLALYSLGLQSFRTMHEEISSAGSAHGIAGRTTSSHSTPASLEQTGTRRAG